MEFNLLQPKLNCNFSHFKFEYKVSTPKKKKKMDTINMVKNDLKKKIWQCLQSTNIDVAFGTG